MFKSGFLLKQFCLCFSIFLLSVPGYSAVRSYYGASELNPLIQVDETSGITTLNIYAGGARVATVAISGNDINITPSYIHKDHLSSTTLVTDASASMLAAFDYQPFGESTAYGDSASSVTYRYSSEQYEPETGLYNYHSRLYSPTTGTFGALDPAGLSISPYTAFTQNPVNYRDLNGQGPITSGAVKVYHFVDKRALIDGIKRSGAVKTFGEIRRDPEFSHLMEENVSNLASELRQDSTFWTPKNINDDISAAEDKWHYIERMVDPANEHVFNMLKYGDQVGHKNSKMRLQWYKDKEADLTGQKGFADFYGSNQEPTRASTRSPDTGEYVWYDRTTLMEIRQNPDGTWEEITGRDKRSVKQWLASEDHWSKDEKGLWKQLAISERSAYVAELIKPGKVEVAPSQIHINEQRVEVAQREMPRISEHGVIE